MDAIAKLSDTSIYISCPVWLVIADTDDMTALVVPRLAKSELLNRAVQV